MALIGSIEAFKPKEDDITSYLERMEQLFVCNEIGENKKVPLFLTLIGGEAYAVIKALLSPEIPSTKKYAELEKTLKDHYSPKRLVIAERYKLYNCSQDNSEDLTSFMEKLKKLSKYAEFGTFLTEALRDKFVCGLKSEAIRRKLLSEEDLTYGKAVKIALSMELAEGQAKAISSSEVINKVSSYKGKINKYPEASSSVPHNKFRNNQSERQQLKSHQMGKSPCQRCLRFHNDPTKCPAKSWRCFTCNVMGHTAKSPLCRGRVHFMEEEEDTLEREEFEVKWTTQVVETVNQLVGSPRCEPIMLELIIENKVMPFEVDTGSDSTIISFETFKKLFPNVELGKSNIKLKTLFGQVQDNVLHANVNVQFGSIATKLNLKVVEVKS
ncbi:uncharacterized protein [Diabrotica undecimpunctata]|uniref:uncharacterized protein n=1 Tax=Diabrotica undecimpunctata TaxID=50387 RepID=UPI003B63BFDE